MRKAGKHGLRKVVSYTLNKGHRQHRTERIKSNTLNARTQHTNTKLKKE